MHVRNEIENLLFLYAERVDAGDFNGVAELFSNGEIVGPDGEVAAGGHDAVLALYQHSTRLYPDNGTPHTKHVTSNVIVDADEANHIAKARSYFTVFQQVDDFPLQAIISGRYHDTFEKAAGKWRFKQRCMLPELFGDLSKHLLIDVGGVPSSA
ncbi:MAG: nuclear transport factor 2 family protein [Pseudomonadales bacterium]